MSDRVMTNLGAEMLVVGVLLQDEEQAFIRLGILEQIQEQ
jgi:hypothetical protein